MRKLNPFIAAGLISVFPILSLAAANLGEASLTAAVRPLLASIALMGVLFVILLLFTRDPDKAALISTGALLFLFSYGHLYALVRNTEVFGFVIGRHRYLISVFIALLTIWAWVVLRRLGNISRWSAILAVIGAAALLLPLITIVNYELQTRRSLSRLRFDQTPAGTSTDARSMGEPDIYYIVLDGYGRADVLSDIYDLDNSQFVDFLEGHGFYVAEESQANYIQTALSLSSSLNMSYVNDLADMLGKDSTNRGPLNARIHKNVVVDALASRGYEVVAFNTGLEATSIENADVYLPSKDNPFFRGIVPGTWRLSPFEGLLLETTLARALFDLFEQLGNAYFESVVAPQYQVHRERILYTLEELAEISDREGPQFVFAHVVAPHPPFVFGSAGERQKPNVPFAYHDGSDYLQELGTRDEYIAGYREQVTHLNRLLETSIREILAKSEPAPIIILQSDHGPGAFLDWQSVSNSNLDERLSILNAYHLPGAEINELYPSISPVNSFRVIFNIYFGENYPLLDDRAYFSSSNRPYDFTRIH